MSDLHIRGYRPADLVALYDICLRTGAAGEDATHLVEDPELFGHVYAGAYATLEPERAVILGDPSGPPLGYVLAALDTEGFEARCESEWWPELRARYPRPDADDRGLDALLISLIHTRPTRPASILEPYPSHLHIDLLPEAQGRGWGRQLLGAAFERLAASGSTGVHWGVSTRNRRAIGFYRHLGCVELRSDESTVTFGVDLSRDGSPTGR